MWCLFLSPPSPCPHLIPRHATATPVFKVLVSPVSASSVPRRCLPESLHNDDVSAAQQVGNLGHTLMATLQSNPIPKPQQKRNQEGEGAQIRGSDVLWALQRASASKNKKKQHDHRKGSSSAGRRREESAVDYTNVRPLCIKADWGAKLDELEKRLHELSQST